MSPRYRAFPCRLLLAALLGLLAPVAAALPPANRPQDPQQVLAAATPPTAHALRELRAHRAALLASPGRLDLALRFADAAIALGHREQQPRYFGQAEAALAPWWAHASIEPAARLRRAEIRQWQHQFALARQDLDVLVGLGSAEREPALLMRAALAMVRGDPAAAAADCRALFARDALLRATACLATANGLRGQAQRSLATLEAVLAPGAAADLSTRRWAATSAAELAWRLGDRPRADAHYRAALALMREADTVDAYLLASYADFLLDQQRVAEAAALLAGHERSDPLLLRLALASEPVRRKQLASELDARFAEVRARGESPHAREYAWYLLDLRDDPEAALQQAQLNWATQREPLDARLLLRAAQAASQPYAAQVVLDWLQATGLEDRRLATLVAALRRPVP